MVISANADCGLLVGDGVSQVACHVDDDRQHGNANHSDETDRRDLPEETGVAVSSDDAAHHEQHQYELGDGGRDQDLNERLVYLCQHTSCHVPSGNGRGFVHEGASLCEVLPLFQDGPRVGVGV